MEDETIEGKETKDIGDEPYHECNEAYVKGSKWLMHEAFCLFFQKDMYAP